MHKEVLDWTGGAFVHNHFRLDDLVDHLGDEITPDMAVNLKRYTDGSFSLPAISAYLGELLGTQLLITDTQHPSYVLDPNYDNFEDADKVQFFNPAVQEKTVDLLTQCIVERMKVIRRFSNLSHIMSGVEADILSPKGGLTVHNEGLAQLDYVTASFHSSIWYAAGNESPNKTQSLDMYQYTVANTNVDAISHPTFYIPRDVKLEMTALDWQELFQHMKERGVAFEINLDSTNLVYTKESTLDRDLIALALKVGVPLVMGFDFHYMADWGAYPSPSIILDENEARKLFQTHVENGSVSKLLARVLGNIYALKQLGLEPVNIMNSNQNQFKTWLSQKEA